MTYANSTERAALVSGLRALADFMERNPDVPAPKYTDVYVFPPDDMPERGRRREVDVIASRIGSGIEITSYCHHYQTSRLFGPVAYRAVSIPDDASKGE
jgi:hypothetical protein